VILAADELAAATSARPPSLVGPDLMGDLSGTNLGAESGEEQVPLPFTS
jgi:hypothetical protein